MDDLKKRIKDAGITPAELGYDEINLADAMPDDATMADKKPTSETTAEKEERRTRKYAKWHKLYDSFEVKDMTFEQFAKEMESMTDPRKLQQDVTDILAQKTGGNVTKKQIDDALHAKAYGRN